MPPQGEKYYRKDYQQKDYQNYGIFFVFLILLTANIALLYLNHLGSHRGLTFAMLNIGQGDGLFVESPTGTQLLIDAGPPKKVLGQLSRVMPLFDRHIDGVIITNPDQDHIGGSADVLKTYKVDQVFEPGTFNDSKTYQDLENEIKNKNIEDTVVRRGERLDIGGGAVIDILFPDRDVSDWTSNDGSIVAKLTYGKTTVMLTGDATAKTEGIILSENSPMDLESEILKVGHHGSKTSSSPDFVKEVSPKYALISDGVNNKYGHPHQETLDTFRAEGAEVLRTDLLGSIIMKSDGEKETFSFHK